jgi:hypothetical protein
MSITEGAMIATCFASEEKHGAFEVDAVVGVAHPTAGCGG